MKFKVDRHGQLRIQGVNEKDFSSSQPDELVLSRQETEELLALLQGKAGKS